MNQLYRELHITKQAVSQYARREAVFEQQLARLIIEAEHLRKEHPGCGIEKMYYTLRPTFIGRDRFIELFMELGFRVKTFRNYRRTTFAVFNRYANLIKGMGVSAPSTVWQSDITYIEMGSSFYYAVFLLDVYTKKIVGYEVSNHMRASANINALTMALASHKAPQIHHSDRGSQYIYGQYIDLLKKNNCRISMAISAQDNAYAERINRTIKEEYMDHWRPQDFNQLRRCMRRAVEHYNNKRLHNHLNRMTPYEFETKWYNDQLQNKPLITIFDNQLNLKPVNSI
jgi:putative transposase